MNKFRFHANFVQLIMNNLKGSWFSILLNGEVIGFFQASKGLKKGDPLSPFLFILCLEAFSGGLSFLIQQKLVVPYAIPHNCLVVSNLSFADGMIIFSCGDRQTIKNIMALIDTYQRGSGQKINTSKSSLFVPTSIGVSAIQTIEQLTGIKHSRIFHAFQMSSMHFIRFLGTLVHGLCASKGSVVSFCILTLIFLE
ncbi:hypothetical protein ACH5RR_029410 [Cinchona calisaya]|uniref:Reverse transcriptase domain-containing protein n=1 Tax=Cinchona calisaya TaxID=153742 RepID=A0ABD2YUY4_9GENT